MDYNSLEWLELRGACLERDDYRCRGCNRSADEFQSPLEVHHRVYDYGQPNPLIVPIDELTTLCPECHEAITNIRRRHFYSLKPKLINQGVKRYTPKSNNEGGKTNGVENIEVADYRRAIPINAQRAVSKSVESDSKSNEENIG